jgi:hypothetical protein
MDCGDSFAAATFWLVCLPRVAVMDCGDPSPLFLVSLIVREFGALLFLLLVTACGTGWR